MNTPKLVDISSESSDEDEELITRNNDVRNYKNKEVRRKMV